MAYTSRHINIASLSRRFSHVTDTEVSSLESSPSSTSSNGHKPLPAGPIPRYIIIADRLRQRVESGMWHAGALLPSLHSLAEEFGVARPTARQAVQLLVQEGLLSSRRGQGTFVTQAATPIKTTPLETSLSELAQTYRYLVPRILQINEAPCALPIAADQVPDYIHMRRLHSLNGRPYCVISLYIAQHVFKLAPDKFRSQPVIPLMLANASVHIAQARQTLCIGTADAETATLLGIPVDAPVANVTRIFNSPDGAILYYAEVAYRGDGIRLEIDLKP
jgi:GntR family transcriptional regulator